MNRIAKISGSQSWRNLTGKIVKNRCVEILNCGDIHPYAKGPVFKGTLTVIINSCNKNFVYYWLHQRTFPDVINIYLLSHPCEPTVLRRFPNSNIYLSHDYQQYKTRWANDLNQVNILYENEIQLLNAIDNEELITIE